jgi:hypothetical protein
MHRGDAEFIPVHRSILAVIAQRGDTPFSFGDRRTDHGKLGLMVIIRLKCTEVLAGDFGKRVTCQPSKTLACTDQRKAVQPGVDDGDAIVRCVDGFGGQVLRDICCGIEDAPYFLVWFRFFSSCSAGM